jgi:hypothetical protein
MEINYILMLTLDNRLLGIKHGLKEKIRKKGHDPRK